MTIVNYEPLAIGTLWLVMGLDFHGAPSGSLSWIKHYINYPTKEQWSVYKNFGWKVILMRHIFRAPINWMPFVHWPIIVNCRCMQKRSRNGFFSSSGGQELYLCLYSLGCWHGRTHLLIRTWPNCSYLIIIYSDSFLKLYGSKYPNYYLLLIPIKI